jgi:hypothetical protein
MTKSFPAPADPPEMEQQLAPEEDAFDYRRQGASFAEIGKAMGIKPEAAQELVASYVRRICPDIDPSVTLRGGPLLSVQVILKALSRTSHPTSIWPAAVESAPYLRALVMSS